MQWKISTVFEKLGLLPFNDFDWCLGVFGGLNDSVHEGTGFFIYDRSEVSNAEAGSSASKNTKAVKASSLGIKIH